MKVLVFLDLKIKDESQRIGAHSAVHHPASPRTLLDVENAIDNIGHKDSWRRSDFHFFV
jgi:hypothetical protein